MAQADSGEVKIEEHNFDKTIYLEFKNQDTKKTNDLLNR